MSAPEDQQPAAPVLRIVRGAPDDLELAALVAVLSAASSTVAVEPPADTSDARWAAPERLQRTPVHPTGWWASALPR